MKKCTTLSSSGVSNVRRKNIVHILRVKEMQNSVKRSSHLKEDYRVIGLVVYLINCGFKL